MLLGTGVGMLAGCRKAAPASAVVVYCSLDELYSRPVMEAFQRETGIRVRAVYDTEATKSRGLAQRILAERKVPLADVFWSSEVLQMVLLASRGVLAPYTPHTAAGIPAAFHDPESRWTGFAGRFRVFAVHASAEQPPLSLPDLTQSSWKGKVAMADPLFGTTTTEAAALFQLWGEKKATDFYRKLRANQVRVVDGNSASADQAARGEVAIGLTDTDDAFIRQDAGKPLRVIYPGQKGGHGALLIPNTAGLVAGAPHAEQGKRFLDFLLRPETELLVAALPARQLPLHKGVVGSLPAAVAPLAKIGRMRVDYHRLADDYDRINRFLRDTFST